MLPSAPKDVGILSDVFVSAMSAVCGVGANKLGFRRVDSAVIVMVDGLGALNLSENLAYASNIRRLLGGAKVPSARVEFPATTAVSLTSFGTGLRSGEHGIGGYQVVDAEGQLVNMLSGWSSQHDPRSWQPHQTIAEMAVAAGLNVSFVGPAEYQDSGFTNVFMRGATYVSAESIGERMSKASALANTKKSLVYCYVPELDKAAHRFGVDSNQWRAALESLDSVLGSLVDARFGALLTADHGVIDVPSANHVLLDSLDGYTAAVGLTAGDPRVAYLFGDSIKARESLEVLGDRVYVVSYEDLVAAGWCTEHTGMSKKPDLLVIARGSLGLYDSRTATGQSMKMIGQHGALEDIEQRVPLIRLGAFI